jgi:hypothetical protein
MITDVLVLFIYYFVLLIVSVISLLGDVTLSPLISQSIATVKPYYMSLDAVFPMATLLVIFAFQLTFEAAYLGYRLLKWAYTKIPGIS